MLEQSFYDFSLWPYFCDNYILPPYSVFVQPKDGSASSTIPTKFKFILRSSFTICESFKKMQFYKLSSLPLWSNFKGNERGSKLFLRCFGSLTSYKAYLINILCFTYKTRFCRILNKYRSVKSVSPILRFNKLRQFCIWQRLIIITL